MENLKTTNGRLQELALYIQEKTNFYSNRNRELGKDIVNYPLDDLKKILESQLEYPEGSISRMAELNKLRSALLKKGLKSLLEEMDRVSMTATDSLNYLDAVRYVAILERAKIAFGEIVGLDYKEKIRLMHKYEEDQMTYNQSLVRFKHRERVSNYLKRDKKRHLPEIIKAKKQTTDKNSL